jgi:gamma-glutamyltranspeptidase/glutathione hydrolase/leukotriene-C4 hydrolase
VWLVEGVYEAMEETNFSNSAARETTLLLGESKEIRKRNLPNDRFSLFCRLVLVFSILVLLLVAVIVGIILGVIFYKLPSSPFTQTYPRAAVATDAEDCSIIGADLMKKGGNAVDAAVGSAFCTGVINLHSTGIGGGGFMLIYNATTQETYALDFREKAPEEIPDEVMDKYVANPTSTIIGGLAIGVPGQVKGLHEAHRQFGKLKWEEVIEPSINIARDGFEVTTTLADAIKTVYGALIIGNFTDLAYV